MKKTLRSIVLACFVSALMPLSSAAQNATLYGYARNYSSPGLVTIAPEHPENATLASGNVTPTAGAIKDSVMYVVGFDDDFNTIFYSVDITNGKAKKISTVPESYGSPQDMAYNYNDEKMYFITNSANEDVSTSMLGTVDLQTGKFKSVVADLGFYARAFSIAADGTMYYVTRDGILCTYDIATRRSHEVGATGVSPRMTFSSMGFDRSANKLYWAVEQNGSYVNNLYEVNTTTGAATLLGVIGGSVNNGEGYWTVGLDAPYAPSVLTAPQRVDSLTATPAEKGGMTVSLSWINPDSTVSGAPLTELDSVVVSTADSVVAVVTDAKPGKRSTATVSVLRSDRYRYHVVAYNKAGGSADRFVETFVGRDVPGKPVYAFADLYGSNKVSNVITWHSPQSGKNGGYYDRASLKYRLVRMNDMKTLADNLADSTFTDDDLPTLQRYQYAVYTKNADGVGDSVLASFIVNGPAATIDTAYVADFNNEADAMLWTPFNANGDYSTFEWHKYSILDRYLYIYQAHETNYAADFLVSPPLEFTEGHAYDITVSACNSFAPYPEAFTVYTMGGNAPHGAIVGQALTDPITINHPDELRDYVFHLSAIPDDGKGTKEDKFASFIAVKCESDPAMQMLLVGGVKIVDITAKAIADGITDVNAAPNSRHGAVYSLTGSMVAKDSNSLHWLAPGVYIVDGKKVVVK